MVPFDEDDIFVFAGVCVVAVFLYAFMMGMGWVK